MAKASRDKGKRPGCIEHQQALPYGRARWQGRNRPIHVVAYLAVGGVVPDGWHVDHLCSNPRCINPDHLEAVTPTENVRRAMKLTPDDVAEIRCEGERLKRPGRRRPKGSRVAIAQRYGVNVKTIRNIWAGATWAE